MIVTVKEQTVTGEVRLITVRTLLSRSTRLNAHRMHLLTMLQRSYTLPRQLTHSQTYCKSFTFSHTLALPPYHSYTKPLTSPTSPNPSPHLPSLPHPRTCPPFPPPNLPALPHPHTCPPLLVPHFIVHSFSSDSNREQSSSWKRGGSVPEVGGRYKWTGEVRLRRDGWGAGEVQERLARR